MNCAIDFVRYNAWKIVCDLQTHAAEVDGPETWNAGRLLAQLPAAAARCFMLSCIHRQRNTALIDSTWSMVDGCVTALDIALTRMLFERSGVLVSKDLPTCCRRLRLYFPVAGEAVTAGS